MYTAFSLARGFAAYAISLAFTLAYGTIAANNRRAEKLMIPALDILQSLPVLTLLPGIELAMIRLFPRHEIGPELACVLAIFTAQAWNMTFSYYSSIRAIPTNLREVSAVHHLNRWQIFRLIEVPSSMIGLVWNSMMSMAGGWFVLNVSEYFPLGDRVFSVPGIGSYMAEANEKGVLIAQIGGVVAMIIMIVAVDQLFWRPIVVWSERFKLEETAEGEKAHSWVLSLLEHSLLYPWLIRQVHRARQRAANKSAAAITTNGDGAATAVLDPPPGGRMKQLQSAQGRRLTQVVLMRLAVAAVAALALWGVIELIKLLVHLPLHDPDTHQDWITVLLGLGASFLRVMATVTLATLWALPVGILIGLSPRWSQRLQPIVQVLASFPANMIYLPLTLFMLHIGIPFNSGCVVLMLLGTQWYVLFNVIAGAMAIPTELKEVSFVFSTPRLRRWLRVYIPGVFPYLVTGLITAAGGAWNTTIIAEFVQGANRNYVAFGVGSIIEQATLTPPNYSLLAAGAVSLALMVVLLNRFMWRRMYRLAEKRYSLET
jgi:NitT/TauT family transport system permease protein